MFNFELPNVPDQYVHRIGRTARAGATGLAVSYCADDERPYLKDIERLTRQKLTIQPLPADFVNEANKIKSTRSPMPVSRDEQNGRNGRAMQHGGRSGGGGQRGGQGQRNGQGPRGDQQRRNDAPRADANGEARPRRFDAPQGEQRGEKPRNYARPKGKFHARPARPGAGAGGRGR